MSSLALFRILKLTYFRSGSTGSQTEAMQVRELNPAAAPLRARAPLGAAKGGRRRPRRRAKGRGAPLPCLRRSRTKSLMLRKAGDREVSEIKPAPRSGQL